MMVAVAVALAETVMATEETMATTLAGEAVQMAADMAVLATGAASEVRHITEDAAVGDHDDPARRLVRAKFYIIFDFFQFCTFKF